MVSFRRDGSSLFGPDNRWGSFPAFSLAWNVAEESFMSSLSAINEMKVRYSWGLNGNNGIPNYVYYGQVDRSNYAFGDNIVNAYYPVSSTNLNLGWEKSISNNIGFDISLFSYGLTLVVDYYSKKTSDLLLNVPVPSASGFTSEWQNIGAVDNKGIEVELRGRRIYTNFSLESFVNFSYNKNEVTALGPEDGDIHAGFGNRTELIRVGEPLGSFYMYDAIGVYMTEEELASSPKRENNIVGDVKYRDVNQDGIIDPDDRTLMGQSQPKYTWGFYNNIQYKNFGLSFLIQGAGGNQIYGILGRAVDRTSSGFGTNLLGHWAERWRSVDDPGNGHVPRSDGTTGGELDSRWLYDATYTRLKNVTISYNIPSSLLSRLKMNSTTVYVSGENLYLWDDYYGGWSPEADNNSGGDYGGYPIARTFSFGINFTF
jgi:TonB-linked SusC/RagA family outer membrane protein